MTQQMEQVKRTGKKRHSMKKTILYLLTIGAMMLGSCSDNESDAPLSGSNATVSFATDVQTLDTRASVNDIVNTDTLKALPQGFGVFAYFTEAQTWKQATTANDNTTPLAVNDTQYPIPDFMYNQQVTWGIQYVEETDNGSGGTTQTGVKDWVYSPLKYWPNTTNNTGNRYISFFAYAPYTSEAEAAATDATGIIGLPTSTDKSPHVDFSIDDDGFMPDLIYASCTDAERNGDGLIEVNGEGAITKYQKVPLKFRHALARVDIYIVRDYDEPIHTGKKPDVEKQAKLFVSQLQLQSTSSIYGKGTLHLETGEWSSPIGIKGDDTDKARTYLETSFNDTISGTTREESEVNGAAYIRDRELNKWGLIYDTTAKEWVDISTISDEDWEKTENKDRWTNSYGVIETERLLLANNKPLIFMPQTLTLTPILTYSMVTRDNQLLLSHLTDTDGNKYSRILNTTAANSVSVNLEPGKRYKLVLRISAEHITFEVVSVVDWDFPIRFTPTIPDVNNYEEEEITHKLDEPDNRT